MGIEYGVKLGKTEAVEMDENDESVAKILVGRVSPGLEGLSLHFMDEDNEFIANILVGRVLSGLPGIGLHLMLSKFVF